MYQKMDPKKKEKWTQQWSPKRGQNRFKREQRAIQTGAKTRHASRRGVVVIVIVVIVAAGARREAQEVPKRVPRALQEGLHEPQEGLRKHPRVHKARKGEPQACQGMRKQVVSSKQVKFEDEQANKSKQKQARASKSKQA